MIIFRPNKSYSLITKSLIVPEVKSEPNDSWYLSVSAGRNFQRALKTNSTNYVVSDQILVFDRKKFGQIPDFRRNGKSIEIENGYSVKKR